MSTRVEARPPAHARQPQRRSSKRRTMRQIRLARLDMKLSPYAYIIPFFVIFGIFGLYPMVYTFWVSLHDWAPGATEHAFIGLDNYAELWNDSQFWNAAGNTVGIFVLSTVPQLTLARKVEINDGTVRIERQTDGGYWVLEAPLPAIVSTWDTINEPRYPSFKGIMAAKKKSVQTLSLADLGVPATDVGLAGATSRVLEAAKRPVRHGGSKVPDSGDGGARLVEFLVTEKFV